MQRFEITSMNSVYLKTYWTRRVNGKRLSATNLKLERLLAYVSAECFSHHQGKSV